MEMYLTIANAFGRFELALFETDEKSMVWRDHGSAVNASHVKVRVKSLLPQASSDFLEESNP